MRYPLLSLVAITLLVPAAASAQIERRLERSFSAEAGSVVTVEMSGAPITVNTGGSDNVQLTLRQVIAVDSDSEADRLLEDYEIVAGQQAGAISFIARRKTEGGENYRRGNSRVRFEATLTVPANIRLDLNTSGGSIAVHGERTAAVDADTSGGSITVDGGRGDMHLDTSGGTIRVARAYGVLHADTSGGSIAVEYLGPDVTDVSLDTSGGSIRVGVDAAAKLDVRAGTSGGGVDIDGLPFQAQSVGRSRASGTLNGGGGQLRANTSGGSIEIRAASGR